MAKVKVKSSVKRNPVKAGSTDKTHGGFPTAKVVKIVTKIKNSKKNG
jgi:hypothetical protein